MFFHSFNQFIPVFVQKISLFKKQNKKINLVTENFISFSFVCTFVSLISSLKMKKINENIIIISLENHSSCFFVLLSLIFFSLPEQKTTKESDKNRIGKQKQIKISDYKIQKNKDYKSKKKSNYINEIRWKISKMMMILSICDWLIDSTIKFLKKRILSLSLSLWLLLVD